MDKHDKDFKLSVVIPAYNAENTITEVLTAIVKQTQNKAIQEIIVVDDGSTDKTAEIVNELATSYDKRIRLIKQSNKGVSAARNAGMRASTGKWIALDDSDDVWSKNKIEKQLQIIGEYPQMDFLGTAWNDKGVKLLFHRIASLSKINVKKMCIVAYPQPSTVVLRKKIFDEIGGFDENQKYAEDGNYFLKICANYECFYLPEQTITYGFGKSGFGDSGLSANLEGMYKGNVKNLVEIHRLGYISTPFFYLMRFYQWMKYIRRIILCRLRKR